ncbi:MAG: hypothetical protein H6809_01815 [Phycisphaeraceae bacterium]|nr:hypothetical protein [Phycisphaeraceae bacterium]
MERSISLVFVLSVLAGILTFVGTLVLTPTMPAAARGGPALPAFGQHVRQLAAQGDWSGVSRESRRVLGANPTHPEALLFRAIASERLGREERARELWTQLAESAQMPRAVRPLGGMSWYYLGWALKGLGDGPGSQDAFRNLTAQMGPAGDYNAACYLALAGQEDAALDAFESVMAGYVARLRAAPDDQQLQWDYRWMLVDPDLDSLRDEVRYLEAVGEYQRVAEEMMPT